jgi:hypothetical protein
MGRLPVLFAALTALAACSEDTPAGSPADSEIRKAIAHFYTAPAGPLSQFDLNYMKRALIVSTGRCKMLDSDYVCPVTFERPGNAGRAMRFVWMTKNTEGWAVIGISSDIPPNPT